MGAKGALDGLATAAKGACFAPGTPLLTPDGWKRIEELQAGDLVLSRDEHNLAAPVEPRVVEEVFSRYARIMHLVVRGIAIQTTSEHPFYVLGHGWLPANEVQEGDFLATETDAWVRDESVNPTDRAIAQSCAVWVEFDGGLSSGSVVERGGAVGPSAAS